MWRNMFIIYRNRKLIDVHICVNSFELECVTIKVSQENFKKIIRNAKNYAIHCACDVFVSGKM